MFDNLRDSEEDRRSFQEAIGPWANLKCGGELTTQAGLWRSPRHVSAAAACYRAASTACGLPCSYPCAYGHRAHQRFLGSPAPGELHPRHHPALLCLRRLRRRLSLDPLLRSVQRMPHSRRAGADEVHPFWLHGRPP